MSTQLHVITGATGLLGSHLAEQLVQRGERVRALVRATSDVGFLRTLGVELVEGSLDDVAAVQHAVAGADVVYHAAARVGDWGSWYAFRTQVIDATRNVVEACRAAQVGRLLHVSSISVYGHPRQGPIHEDAPFGQHLRWLDHYCRAKIAAEQLAWSYPATTVVRPSWIYGPRDRNGLPRLVKALQGGWVKIQGDGNNLLNLVHAADVASGAIRAALLPAARGQAYHLCSPGAISQKDYLDTLCDELGLPRVERHISHRAAYRWGMFGDVVARTLRWQRPPYVSRYSVSLMARPTFYMIDKARTQLDWQPSTPPVAGIRQTVAWYKQNKTIVANAIYS